VAEQEHDDGGVDAGVQQRHGELCRRLGLGEEGDELLAEALGGDGQDLLDERCVFGVARSRVGEQRPDRGQPQVARSWWRADWIFEVPLPGLEARRANPENTIAAVAAAFSGAGRLLDPTMLDSAAADGLDGRRLRKAAAAACAISPRSPGRPGPGLARRPAYRAIQMGGQQ
jgi:hypothetical protein